MRIAAVIPAWNEASRIGPVIRGVRNFADLVIVIDDGSSDHTFDVAKKAGAMTLRHALNRGQGAALKTGAEAAVLLGADIIVHVDADGQHDPSMVQVLTDPIVHGEADIVFGSRFLGIDPTGMPWIRKQYFKLGKIFNSLFLGVSPKITDPQSGARAMNRNAAEQIRFVQDGSAHCSEILALATRSKLRWKEVPVHVRYTQDTLQKGQKFTEAFRILWHLFIRGIKK